LSLIYLFFIYNFYTVEDAKVMSKCPVVYFNVLL